MSMESARLFFKRFKEDETFRCSLENAHDDNARRDIRKREGFDFTREEIQQVMSEPLELNNGDLEAVAGGFDDEPSSSGNSEAAAAAAAV
jgi:predicted ribosomally synthesized peptide with nif11-like leader